MAPLSKGTMERLERLFAPSLRTEAERLLVEQCGNNLPCLEALDAVQLERYRYAALRLSKGTLQGLRQAIDLAQKDWRDLLMNADFGYDVHAHERWTGAGDDE
ncbi:MAG: hypothetical protein AB7O69_05085 [Burkholderiales bacterium]